MRIGLNGAASSVDRMVDLAAEAEADGFATLWYPSAVSGDPLVTIALAGRATTTIELGTSVLQTYTSHPALMANRAQSVVQAMGRPGFTLGVGPSHEPVIEAFGYPYDHVGRHTEEYGDTDSARTRVGDEQDADQDRQEAADDEQPAGHHMVVGEGTEQFEQPSDDQPDAEDPGQGLRGHSRVEDREERREQRDDAEHHEPEPVSLRLRLESLCERADAVEQGPEAPQQRQCRRRFDRPDDRENPEDDSDRASDDQHLPAECEPVPIHV